MEQVRFTAPVKIGDTIRFEGEVTAIDNKDDKRGVLTWTGRIINQRDELCCSVVMKLFCGRWDYIPKDSETKVILHRGFSFGV